MAWRILECVVGTYKKPVLTPHLAFPLIMRGVQKLNMIPKALDEARAQPAV